MLDQTSASPLTDELAPKGGVQPDLASPSSSDPAVLPNTLDASSDMLSDIGSKRLLPALVVRTSTPGRAAGALPVGLLLYLLSVGIVAAATVGVLFGIGFFLLAQPMESAITNTSTGDHASGTKRPLPPTLSNASSTYGDIASVPIEPPIPRSAATAALPVAPPAARPSPAEDVPASDAKDQSFPKGSPASEARSASPPAAPAPGSSTATPAPTPAPVEARNLSAGQITELLARGDSFLHAGDVASARLFYERAADAGDWQAAMRMGATFDPAFLARVGLRARGDTATALSWYRHALDLGAPKTDRQTRSLQTK